MWQALLGFPKKGLFYKEFMSIWELPSCSICLISFPRSSLTPLRIRGSSPSPFLFESLLLQFQDDSETSPKNKQHVLALCRCWFALDIWKYIGTYPLYVSLRVKMAYCLIPLMSVCLNLSCEMKWNSLICFCSSQWCSLSIYVSLGKVALWRMRRTSRAS